VIDVLEDDSTTGSPRALIDRPGPQNLVVHDWAAVSVQGRQRRLNEDSWAQVGPVFVVCDGMGGLQQGVQASADASSYVASTWLTAEAANPEMIVRAASDRVRALTKPPGDGGTTLSALKIAHDQATVVHAGDSRVYRIRGSHAELLTRDHNLRSELLAAGITPGSSRSQGPLRALTSYLGKRDHELQIDVRSVSLRAGDRLVLCTDGVFDELSHGEFSSRCRTGSATNAARRLTALRSSDDATAVVVDVGSDHGFDSDTDSTAEM